jgi:pyruvate formate lyase activating enzyme
MSIQPMQSTLGERIIGQWFTPEDLASRLNKYAAMLKTMDGGVTFSGGEPLMQSEFVAATIDQLKDIHITLDTSGFGPLSKFLALVKRSHLVLYDIKIMDERQHKNFTRYSNAIIKENLLALSDSGVPFYIRIPLVPRVTDTRENVAGIVRLIKDLPGLLGVDLLPYNKFAAGKYIPLRMDFYPGFDQSIENKIHLSLFHEAGIRVKIL